jgi:hypothetical protein
MIDDPRIKTIQVPMPASDEVLKRSRQQIINECVYAVACCIDHYCDEGLSAEGVAVVRAALEGAISPYTGSGIAYRENEGQYPEFSDRIIWPVGWWVTERNPE